MHQTLATSRKTSNACNVLALCTRDNPAILTIAHRGFWTATAENSLASVRAAVAAGVEMIEIDTQATADGRLVVIHDETLDRTTTGKGTVSALPFEVVRAAKLKAGAGGDGADVTDECVPTLEEVLEEARGRITVNIDTKFTRDLPQVMETVLRLGVEDQVLVKTDVDPEAERFEVLGSHWFGRIPHMPMFPVRKGKFAEDLRRIEALKAPMIEVKFTDIADLAEGVPRWSARISASGSTRSMFPIALTLMIPARFQTRRPCGALLPRLARVRSRRMKSKPSPLG